jgi:hypothetical protein
VIQTTLRAAVKAGCDDLIACAGEPCCPLPFVELTLSVPETRPPYATWAYPWRRPPSRSRLMTLKSASTTLETRPNCSPGTRACTTVRRATPPGPATIPAVTVAATMRGNVAPTLCLDPGQQPLRIL